MTKPSYPSFLTSPKPLSILLLLLLFPFPLFADNNSTVCSSVRIADNGREDVAIFNGILASLLSLSGYTPLLILVEPKNTLLRIQQQKADVFLATWKKAHPPLPEKNDILFAPKPLFPHAQYTLAVPQYLAEKGLTSIHHIPQFKNTLSHTLFAFHETQHGQKIINQLINDNPLFSDFSLSLLKEKESTPFIQQKIQNKQDFVILAWEPHLHNSLFNLVFLTHKESEASHKNPFPSDDLFAVTHKNFPQKCPQVAQLIHQLQVPRTLINSLMKTHLVDKKPLKQSFLLWLSQHKRFLAASLAKIKSPNGKNAFTLALHALEKPTPPPSE